jgi:fatty acid desaturase
MPIFDPRRSPSENNDAFRARQEYLYSDRFYDTRCRHSRSDLRSIWKWFVWIGGGLALIAFVLPTVWAIFALFMFLTVPAVLLATLFTWMFPGWRGIL